MTRKHKNFACLLLSWTLIFNIAFGSTLMTLSRPAMAGGSTDQSDLYHFHEIMGQLDLDPTIAKLEEDGAAFPYEIQLGANDPLVDEDPYFLRAQSWSATDATGSQEDILFRTDDDGVEIQPRGLSKTWHLNAPLHPILETSEYLYLAANDPKFFAARDNGQGVFVVPYHKLIASSVTSAHVPVFFFPLTGQGWAANIAGSEIPHHDLVTIKNTQGFELPINVSDVRSVVQIETLNMLFAISQGMDQTFKTLNSNPSAADSARASMQAALAQLAKESQSNSTAPSAHLVQLFSKHQKDLLTTVESIVGTNTIELPRGSTAGYGMVYTGLDRDHPELGSVIFSAAARPQSFGAKIVAALGISSAHALEPTTAKFLRSATRVLVVAGLAYITSIVLKQTVFKQELERRIEEGLAKGETKSQVSRRMTWDVFAHVMTTLSQFPSVWSAQTLRYVLDRGHVGENNVVRKLFNGTFGFGLRTSDMTPVNAKTLLYGVGGLGGVDTVLVAFQGYFLLQWMAHGLAWLVPSMAPRVAEAYGSGNSAVAVFLMLQVVQNFIGYLTSGAYSFAHDVQTNKTNEGEGVVAEAMRGEGKDPKAPDNKKEYDTRLKEYVRAAMKREGLPSEKDFLFDANSLYAKVRDFFGYAAPAGKDSRTYKGTDRPGLMVRALNAAVRDAGMALRADPSSVEKQQALVLLKESRADASLIWSFVEHPSWYLTPTGLLTIAKKFKVVRRSLTSFTFDGKRDDAVTEIPQSWTNRSPEGAQRAAQAFRNAFFGLIEDAKPANPIYGKIGSALAVPFKFLDRSFENWQIQRALTRASEKFIAQAGVAPDDAIAEPVSTDPSEGRKLWESLFQKELVRVAGLFPDYKNTALLKEVEDKAIEKLNKRMESDEDFKAELAKLPPALRLHKLMLQKADYFSESYVEATIRGEAVPALSPSQPGMFQRVRQWEIVRKAPLIVTKFLRSFEALGSNTNYSRGLWPQLQRSVPMLSDFAQGNLIVAKNTPVGATIGYWWSVYFWGAGLPRPDWLFYRLIAGSAIQGPWMTTLRWANNLGIKPNASFKNMLGYAAIGSFATMGGMFLFPMYQHDFKVALNTFGEFCSHLLTGQ